MSSQSLIYTIINKNRLIGPNYVVWKRNFKIVLEYDHIKYVLDTSKLDPPANNDIEVVR